MSNPYLRPKDPRFSRPSVTNADGKNRFADGDQSPTAAGNSTDNLFAAGPSTADQPYQPRYEATVQSRGIFLLVLAILGIAGVGTGMSSVVGWSLGWIFPLLATVSSTTAWLLAYQDLQTMQSGAMENSGETMTRISLWLGLAGIVAGLGSVGAMIWLGLGLLPYFL